LRICTGKSHFPAGKLDPGGPPGGTTEVKGVKTWWVWGRGRGVKQEKGHYGGRGGWGATKGSSDPRQ